jgi:hypothetical protein
LAGYAIGCCAAAGPLLAIATNAEIAIPIALGVMPRRLGRPSARAAVPANASGTTATADTILCVIDATSIVATRIPQRPWTSLRWMMRA